jgi:predicted Zn-dependent protease
MMDGQSVTPTPMPDFLSAADCEALMRRAVGFTRGGGVTSMSLDSTWTGNVRWARNRISNGGDSRSNRIFLTRRINGAGAMVEVNMIDDTSLTNGVRRAEHVLLLGHESLESDLHDAYQEPISHPKIWFDTTYHFDAGQRAAIVRTVIEPIEQAGMLSAGYLEIKATGRSAQSTGTVFKPLYYPWTAAQFSLTVRDPQGTGSGWAGVDWNDWSRIDAPKLARIALDKCLRSRNPVRVEPGRYTTILEPQAVCDLMGNLVRWSLGRDSAETGRGPFAGPRPPLTKIGQKVMDERITITADPMDPDLGFPPFDLTGRIYNPVTWIENGVLRSLAYSRPYAMKKLFLNSSLENSGAFHMTGGTTSIDEMIQTTKRGLLVTRFFDVDMIDGKSVLCSGYTRDGLWLIEEGKISKSVKNFRFTESPLFVFNQVEQLGVPQRVFHPGAPVVAPSAKVRDFSFTSLADAV